MAEGDGEGKGGGEVRLYLASDWGVYYTTSISILLDLFIVMPCLPLTLN